MKCPICNSTFEPTQEEIKNSQPWGVRLCSEKCWMMAHKGQSPAGHRWEYHVGEKTPVQKPGKQTGRVDHSKFREFRRRRSSEVGEALQNLFK